METNIRLEEKIAHLPLEKKHMLMALWMSGRRSNSMRTHDVLTYLDYIWEEEKKNALNEGDIEGAKLRGDKVVLEIIYGLGGNEIYRNDINSLHLYCPKCGSIDIFYVPKFNPRALCLDCKYEWEIEPNNKQDEKEKN